MTNMDMCSVVFKTNRSKPAIFEGTKAETFGWLMLRPDKENEFLEVYYRQDNVYYTVEEFFKKYGPVDYGKVEVDKKYGSEETTIKPYRVENLSGSLAGGLTLFEGSGKEVLEWLEPTFMNGSAKSLRVCDQEKGAYYRVQEFIDLYGSENDSKEDSVNHPSHYTQYEGMEVIELTERMSFNLGNAVKYIARAGFKNPDTEIEDLRKAIFYIQRESARVFKIQGYGGEYEELVQTLSSQMMYNRAVAVQFVCRQNNESLAMAIEHLEAEIGLIERRKAK